MMPSTPGRRKTDQRAIDELGKLLFLRIHLEKSPRYKLQEGAGKGKLFADIYSSAYVKKNGKVAVTELKDAFRKSTIYPNTRRKTLPVRNTIFAYDGR